MTKILRALLLPSIFCLFLIQGILFLHHDLTADGVSSLQQSQFISSGSMFPPKFDHQDVEPRTLPDNWNSSQRGVGGSGWYALSFQQEEKQDSLWGIFVPRANMNIAVFINNIEVGSSGTFNEPIARNWARPIYYTIPAGTISPGENIIHLHLKAYAYDGGGVSKIFIGPHQQLLPLYEGRYFLQVDISMIVFFLNIFAGLIMLTLWALQRQEPTYGWFALSCFSSSFFISNHFIRDIPFDRDLWQWATHISIGWFAFSLLAFARRFVERDQQPWERYLLSYMLLSSITLVAFNHTSSFLLWHIGSLSMASYASALLFNQWATTKEAAHLVIFCSFLVTLFLGFHDWATRFSDLQFSYPVLMHLGPPVMLMAITWILITRFVQSANQNVKFNATLIQRVQETKEALHTEHQKVQTLLQQETEAKERNRIMKDLHDGLGGYLMSAHSIARMNEYDEGLQHALNDAIFWLRSSIDTLDSSNEDISALLGTLRFRLEPQLKSSGIQLKWHMDDLSHCTLPSEYKLHLMRIIQESITNVIKHAQASTISISTTLTSNSSIGLEIKDNGQGFSNTEEGHGMGNMRSRIESMGGSFELLTGKQGSALTFSFEFS